MYVKLMAKIDRFVKEKEIMEPENLAEIRQILNREYPKLCVVFGSFSSRIR